MLNIKKVSEEVFPPKVDINSPSIFPCILRQYTLKDRREYISLLCVKKGYPALILKSTYNLKDEGTWYEWESIKANYSSSSMSTVLDNETYNVANYL